MTNYKFILSYDGTRFKGWEHQPGTDMTIQGKLENVLEKMTGKSIEVIGCGRTDAGVHARAYVCNARMDADMTLDEIREYMNHYLPDDICVNEVKIASDRFHSRYNATGKTYCYSCYIGERKPVFDRKYVYTFQNRPDGKPIPRKNGQIVLDVKAMEKAAQYLCGEHDFASFCSNPRMKKSTVRLVDSIRIEKKGDYLYMTFHGTGFLQHMVRILTGTLLEVGLGERDSESIPALIEMKDRRCAGFTAPAQGLMMMQADY